MTTVNIGSVWKLQDFLRSSAASEDVHIDPLGPWSDLDLNLTSPEVKFSNYPLKVNKYMCRTGSTSRTRWCHFFLFISPITKKLLTKNHLRENEIFIWWTLEPKLLTLGQIWMKNVMRRAPQCFFPILPIIAMIIWEIIAIVCKKSLCSQNLSFGDLWWPQYWPWPETNCSYNRVKGTGSKGCHRSPRSSRAPPGRFLLIFFGHHLRSICCWPFLVHHLRSIFCWPFFNTAR